MDPTGMQNRLSGGKRRKDAFCGEEEVVHDNQKMSRRWMSSRGDEGDSNDHLGQVNQALELRGMSVDHWMRLQQHQQPKMEPAAPGTPLNLQQPLNVQQRSTAASLHDMRAMDSSKQAMLSCPSSSQQLGSPQHSAHSQLTQQPSQLTQQPLQHMSQRQKQPQHMSQHQHQHQHQLQHQHQHQQQLAQQPGLSGGGQVHKFQEQVSPLQQQQQQHTQMPSYLDVSSCSRPSSNLPSLPLSFRPPPVFAEAELRHSPTSSSSNQYPTLQNVMTHHHHQQQQQQQQQQRLLLQNSSLLQDCDEDRFSSMLSGQSSVLQQQSSTGLSGTSNSLVLQELQASGGWYSPMRELDSQQQQQQPNSGSRLGRGTLLNGQNGNLYSSASLSDLTSQTGLAPLPGQSCPSGSSFRDSPVDQDQLLGGDPQSPIPYGMSGSSSSSVVGPKSSCSPLPRANNNINKQPIYQADYQRRGVGGMINGPYCASISGPDLLNQATMMTNGAGAPMPDDTFIPQRGPPMPRPMRTYTKVYKLGAIGRALDVTRFSNYTELRCELARMFNLEGQLDQNSGWQLVFLDNENDILLVGDDPWEEFVSSVRGIRILSPSEVFFYMNEERTGTQYNTL